ncbi:hypothetical protein DIE18_02215 [Burkholderia sp. Bp9125]|nr:hypothetical protein DIE18_02215 [Burkholderia sp. Bp9125]
MLKKSLVAVLAVLGGIAALPASAADSLKCNPPVLEASSATSQSAGYTIQCAGADHRSVAPVVVFTGSVPANGTAPYRVDATYAIDVRGDGAREMSKVAREDQLATGTLQSSTPSVAALPTQFSGQTVWDATSGTLSIEERPGHWHVYALQVVDDAVTSEQSLTDAGFASAPVSNGHTTAIVVFGKDYSRFASRGAGLPVVKADLDLRDGKLEFLVGDSRASSAAAIQSALSQLDRKPADITRAWALASRAQLLGLDDEVHYAEQKVAAHNPQLLEEFQRDVSRIKPYVLPAK